MHSLNTLQYNTEGHMAHKTCATYP